MDDSCSPDTVSLKRKWDDVRSVVQESESVLEGANDDDEVVAEGQIQQGSELDLDTVFLNQDFVDQLCPEGALPITPPVVFNPSSCDRVVTNFQEIANTSPTGEHFPLPPIYQDAPARVVEIPKADGTSSMEIRNGWHKEINEIRNPRVCTMFKDASETEQGLNKLLDDINHKAFDESWDCLQTFILQSSKHLKSLLFGGSHSIPDVFQPEHDFFEGIEQTSILDPRQLYTLVAQQNRFHITEARINILSKIHQSTDNAPASVTSRDTPASVTCRLLLCGGEEPLPYTTILRLVMTQFPAVPVLPEKRGETPPLIRDVRVHLLLPPRITSDDVLNPKLVCALQSADMSPSSNKKRRKNANNFSPIVRDKRVEEDAKDRLVWNVDIDFGHVNASCDPLHLWFNCAFEMHIGGRFTVTSNRSSPFVLAKNSTAQHILQIYPPMWNDIVKEPLPDELFGAIKATTKSIFKRAESDEHVNEEFAAVSLYRVLNRFHRALIDIISQHRSSSIYQKSRFFLLLHQVKSFADGLPDHVFQIGILPRYLLRYLICYRFEPVVHSYTMNKELAKYLRNGYLSPLISALDVQELVYRQPQSIFVRSSARMEKENECQKSFHSHNPLIFFFTSFAEPHSCIHYMSFFEDLRICFLHYSQCVPPYFIFFFTGRNLKGEQYSEQEMYDLFYEPINHFYKIKLLPTAWNILLQKK